jgi:hypothetical protein
MWCRPIFPSEWRLGQTLANVAMTAGRLDAGGVWDLEDEEALAAVHMLLQQYSQGEHVSAIQSRSPRLAVFPAAACPTRPAAFGSKAEFQRRGRVSWIRAMQRIKSFACVRLSKLTCFLLRGVGVRASRATHPRTFFACFVLRHNISLRVDATKAFPCPFVDCWTRSSASGNFHKG